MAWSLEILKKAILVGRPQFRPKDTVWVIKRPERCQESEVTEVLFELYQRGKKNYLVHTGYRLDAYIDRRTDSLGFPPEEVYPTQAAADRDAAWYPVTGFSYKKWDAAIGNTKKIAAVHRMISKAKLENLPDLEPCELMRHCSCVVLDRIRFMLQLCKSQRGLIERDRKMLIELLFKNPLHHFFRGEQPVLEEILAKLQITFPAKPRQRRTEK